MAELDLADLSLASELSQDHPAEFSGTAGLARIVMYASSEPWLTRAKARYELMLLAPRDPDIAAVLNEAAGKIVTVARAVVAQWHPADSAPDPELAEDQAIATMAFINGVMMTFVAGVPVVNTVEHLDLLIQGIIAGIAQHRPR